MVDFYDIHAHCITKQEAGILIGLEGSPKFDNTLTNIEVKEIASNNKNFIPAYYINNEFNNVPNELVLKYHPRREKYSVDAVINDLKKRKCKLCIIDTLNYPEWQPIDYLKVVQFFKNIDFILPHMGGYDILEFVKILDFNKNVYGDFSMTQEYFGWCGDKTRMSHVADLIDYCINSPKLSKRILFGSDEPFFSQEKALQKYITTPYACDILRNNFINLMNKIY